SRGLRPLRDHAPETLRRTGMVMRRWCGIGLLFFGSGMALCLSAAAYQLDGPARPQVISIDHTVQHTSTIPANAGQSVWLFVREHDGSRGERSRKAVLMIHGRSVPALVGFDLRTGHNDLHQISKQWLKHGGEPAHPGHISH